MGGGASPCCRHPSGWIVVALGRGLMRISAVGKRRCVACGERDCVFSEGKKSFSLRMMKQLWQLWQSLQSWHSCFSVQISVLWVPQCWHWWMWMPTPVWKNRRRAIHRNAAICRNLSAFAACFICKFCGCKGKQNGNMNLQFCFFSFCRTQGAGSLSTFPR